MTWEQAYTIGEFEFTFIGFNGSVSSNGVIVNPKLVDLNNPKFLDAFAQALRLYPAVDAYAYLENDIYESGIWKRQSLEQNEARLARLMECKKILETANHPGLQLTDEMVDHINSLEAEIERKKLAQSKPKKAKQPNGVPGYVYLIQSPTGAFKIGRTQNPDDRMKTFSVKLPFEVEYVCVIETPDMYGFERQLHNRYSTKRVNGEWFKLDPEDVEYIKSLGQVAT